MAHNVLVHPAKVSSLRVLWDAADRLLAWAGLPVLDGDDPRGSDLLDSDDSGSDDRDDSDRDRDLKWRELSLLVDLATGVVPPPLVEALLPFDFVVPESAAAYRLLLAASLDAEVARARAVEPDVAGLLSLVLDLADNRAEARRRSAFSLGLAWTRRHLLVEAERLQAEAARLGDDDALGPWETFTAMGRVLDDHHARLESVLTNETPPDVPRALPSAHRRLLDGALEPGVPLEDEVIARTVVDLVLLADRRVLVAVPWIREDELAEAFATACVARVRAGVRVLIVTRPVKPSRGFEEAARAESSLHKRLIAAGVEIVYNRRLHDKLFIVDDTAVVGSMNLTRSDIRINRNSAMGLGLPMAVEHFAQRIESLATAPSNPAPAPRVPDDKLPLFGYCYDGLVHRLQVAGTADLGALEGGTEAVAACGHSVIVDSVSRAAVLLGCERCGRRECRSG